jgi:hypothetical protein
MIKTNSFRYNPMDFRVYYPHENPVGNPCIVIEWIQVETTDTTIVFASEKERDDELKVWDEALLIVKDGKVVVNPMPIDLPFIIGGGGNDPSGGISLQ